MGKNFDIAVLGGGPAGYVAAIRAAQLGASVVLIEKTALGGVCMNVGCIPTKALIHSSHAVQEVKNVKEHGIDVSIDETQWGTAVLRKDRIVKMLGKGIEHLMKTNNITVLNGEGSIISKTEISVLLSENSQETRINCKKMIIATGSRPLLPHFIKGCELEGVLTSTTALNLSELPKHIVVIGGGVIGLEFAAMFCGAGSSVTVLELATKILPNEDDEISQELLKLLKRKGIKFELGVKVERIEKKAGSENSELNICFKSYNSSAETDSAISGDANRNNTPQNDEKFISCDNVLLAVGRSFNSEVASNIGLQLKNGHIIVDENMQTSVSGVYAAGDVIGGKLLAHLSFAQGRTAAENAVGALKSEDCGGISNAVSAGAETASEENGHKNAVSAEFGANFYGKFFTEKSASIPSCIYTTPEVASVGLSEKAARELGINVKVARSDFRANGRAHTLSARDGFVKIVADENCVIIGGQILGENASELISEITLAVNLRATANAIANTVHPHPSLSEAIWEACNKIAGTPIHT